MMLRSLLFAIATLSLFTAPGCSKSESSTQSEALPNSGSPTKPSKSLSKSFKSSSKPLASTSKNAELLKNAKPSAPDTDFTLTASKTKLLFMGKEVLPIDCITEEGKACAEADYTKKSNLYRIDKFHKRDQDENQFLIQTLHNACEARASEAKDQKERNQDTSALSAALVLDKDLPYRMVTELVYTLGMCEVSDISFTTLGKPSDGIRPIGSPRMATGKRKAAEKPTAPPLNITVLATERGLKLSVNEHYRDRLMTAGVELRVPVFNTPFGPDLRQLYNRLSALKKLAETTPDIKDTSTINIGAQMNVPWSVMGGIIDTVRSKLPKERYQSAEAFRQAKATEDPLFPAVVFVVAQVVAQ